MRGWFLNSEGAGGFANSLASETHWLPLFGMAILGFWDNPQMTSGACRLYFNQQLGLGFEEIYGDSPMLRRQVRRRSTVTVSGAPDCAASPLIRLTPFPRESII